MERVLDDAADHLRREVGEPRSEGRGEGFEVVALVAAAQELAVASESRSNAPPPRLGDRRYQISFGRSRGC